MYDISLVILHKLTEDSDLDIDSYPLGDQIEKSLGGEFGSPYFEILLNNEKIKNQIFMVRDKLGKCKKNISTTCKEELKKEIKETKKIFEKEGLLFNDDILNIFWPPLKGVW